MEYKHNPVMLKEVLEYANIKRGGFFIDCTLGGGEYTFALAKRVGNNGRVLAIDMDDLAIKNAQRKITQEGWTNVMLSRSNFRNLSRTIGGMFEEGALFQGVILDLGMSSAQLDDEERGFSFNYDRPLNMSFSQIGPEGDSVDDIVNTYSEDKIKQIIKDYSQERFAQKIAKKIVEKRKKNPLKSTKDIVDVILEAIPKKYHYKRLHPATKTFQALRMATNQEVENLQNVLPQAVPLLVRGGRLIVISFHSVEDRIVKNFFKRESKDCICPPERPTCECNHKATLEIITKNAITPTEKELEKNPRARSAKMRVAKKI